jgi:hypothetical protein
MLWMAGRRYRHAHRQLHAGRPLPGAVLSASTAVLATLVGLTALVWIISV